MKHMRFRKRNIRNILQRFGIFDKPTGVHSLLEAVSEPEARFVLLVNTQSGHSLVMKLTCSKRYPHDLIERQSRFSECLRSSGIQTPRRYNAEGAFCILCPIHGFNFSVTLEDYVGEELKTMNMTTAEELGELLACCHEASQRSDCTLGVPTMFCPAEQHEMNAYDEFCALSNAPGIDSTLHNSVKRTYDTRLQQTLQKLTFCPKHAVQGDFSINNLSRQNGELYLFDYNNAGDDYLVADMVTQGIFISRDMEYETPHDPIAMYNAFIGGYSARRQLSEAEKDAANDYYAVSSAMWASGITEWDGSLSDMLKSGNCESANRQLADMLRELSKR